MAMTPYRRVLALSSLPEDRKAALSRLYGTLNPATLRREISRLQDRLLALARKNTPEPSTESTEVASL